jgi:biopolymer transport protein ExbB
MRFTKFLTAPLREIPPMPTLSTSSREVRFRAWVLMSLAWILGLAVVMPGSYSHAQEAKKDAAAPPAVAPAADAPAAAAASAPAPQKKSMLRWALDASGPIGVFLVLLSIYFTALVVRLFLEFRLSEAVPPALIEKLETAIKDRKFQDAYDACRDDNSFLARLVRTGVANLPNGRAEAKEAMTATAQEIVVTMEARISYLATIGTLGPMIGLVGTIWGMIMSFQEIATAAGAQPRADKVAEGISTALFITLEGVSISVPAIFFYAMFRNRISLITMEATKVAERTIAAFWTAAKQPQGAPATAASAPKA